MKNSNGLTQSSTGKWPEMYPLHLPRTTFRWMTLLMVCWTVLFGQTVFSQCPVVCNGSFTAALDADGLATITTDMLLQGDPNACNGTFTVDITDTLGNNYGNQVDGNQIGVFLEATLSHSGGNSCTSTLTVVDNTPPLLTCPQLFIYCNINPNPSIIGFPSISDNVTAFNNLSIAYSDEKCEVSSKN